MHARLLDRIQGGNRALQFTFEGAIVLHVFNKLGCAEVRFVEQFEADAAGAWESGCWQFLPREFPAWGTVYHYFRTWKNAGVWTGIQRTIYEQVRAEAGRSACPSVVIMDGPLPTTMRVARGHSGKGFQKQPGSAATCISYGMHWIICRGKQITTA